MMIRFRRHIDPIAFLTESLERAELVHQCRHLRRCRLCSERLAVAAILQSEAERLTFDAEAVVPFPITKTTFRLPSAFRLLPSAFRLPPSAFRLPPSAFRLPLSALRFALAAACLAIVGLLFWTLTRPIEPSQLASYEPYPLGITEWRGQTPSQSRVALDFYRQKRYAEVVRIIDQNNEPASQSTRLLRAISLYLAGETERAASELNILEQVSPPPLREIAQWYAAQCALATNNAGVAQRRLHVLADRSGPFQKAASEQLQKLKQLDRK